MSDISPEPLADDMPESVKDVVGAIGLAATLKLIDRFGGSRVYVPCPEFITEDHDIAQAIGVPLARKLAALCRNERMELPRAAKAIRSARDRALRRDRAGMSASQCARKYQMTERQVYSIVGRARCKTQSKVGERAAPDSNRIIAMASTPNHSRRKQPPADEL